MFRTNGKILNSQTTCPQKKTRVSWLASLLVSAGMTWNDAKFGAPVTKMTRQTKNLQQHFHALVRQNVVLCNTAADLHKIILPDHPFTWHSRQKNFVHLNNISTAAQNTASSPGNSRNEQDTHVNAVCRIHKECLHRRRLHNACKQKGSKRSLFQNFPLGHAAVTPQTRHLKLPLQAENMLPSVFVRQL